MPASGVPGLNFWRHSFVVVMNIFVFGVTYLVPYSCTCGAHWEQGIFIAHWWVSSAMPGWFLVHEEQ